MTIHTHKQMKNVVQKTADFVQHRIFIQIKYRPGYQVGVNIFEKMQIM
jgi:hypothetical protein